VRWPWPATRGRASSFPQTELAEQIGATREAVTKALADLRRLGAVETGRRRMRIVDRAKLLASMGI